MGKTYRDNIVWSRSVSFKSDHSRGFAKEKDRTSHHSHRNENRSCDDETAYVPFNKDFKRERFAEYDPNRQRMNIANDNHDLMTVFSKVGWQHGTLAQNLRKQISSRDVSKDVVIYMKNSLKQVERRGAATRFCGHDKETDKVER